MDYLDKINTQKDRITLCEFCLGKETCSEGGERMCENKLPTKEKYAQSVRYLYKEDKWSRPIYLCPKCKIGGMCRDTSFTYCSLPPKYDYKCDKCGYEEVYF